MALEWITRKIVYLNEINNEEVLKEELQSIEIKLKSLTSVELRNVASNLDFSRLYCQLTSNHDRDNIEHLCNICSVLFSTLEPSEIYQTHSLELMKNLYHPDSSVKKLILNEFNKVAEFGIPELLNDIDLLNAIIEQVNNEDLGVANLAANVIKKIGKYANGAKVLYSGKLLRTIAKILSRNDAVSFRIYEAIVDIAKSSKESFDISVDSGLLNSLINILENEDILLQLNALEAITDLAACDEGLNYLEQREILSEFNKKVSRVHENPLSTLLIPGLMKFFGIVAKSRPNEIFAKYPDVVAALFDVIDTSEDMVILMNALDTLGYVASSIDGKYALDNLGQPMRRALSKISEIIRKMPTEVRLRGLENLALILHVDRDKQNNRVLTLTKSWFDSLENNPMDMIVQLCKQPFPDIKQSSLKILLEIAMQPWGQHYIAIYPGLIEFLLNRDAEAFKECKELKYEILKSLASSDSFDSSILLRLNKYVQEGPFHVDADVEVATEGGAST
ncbi:26S proteasome non-ATPase regulatory subunit 5 [Chelonus insularis]|uniref:26S proteasome non-ATPase regulatory subunit 5 n=1 Tax=Chelonus insularis TaxID=460826 RepID=UPI00158DB706|nr:26S proteasome non-ATPase regulatory subunit 5 [Chelonus insularis]